MVANIRALCPKRPSQNENRKRSPDNFELEYELRSAGPVRFGVAAFGRKPPSKFRPRLHALPGRRHIGMVAPFQSARGLAQSKTLRVRRAAPNFRQVLDCGSPLPLFPRHHRAIRVHPRPSVVKNSFTPIVHPKLNPGKEALTISNCEFRIVGVEVARTISISGFWIFGPRFLTSSPTNPFRRSGIREQAALQIPSPFARPAGTPSRQADFSATSQISVLAQLRA